MSDVVAPPVRVGYYVHHHGRGHRARFEKVRDAASVDLVGLSELDLGDGVRLLGDVPDEHRDTTAGGSLHWAPIASPGPALRTRQIIEWIVRVRPVGVVVDVSVETALLCRLAGVATVVVRQHGDRIDDPHVAAYRSAERLLAPFPAELEHRRTPQWVVDKTDHVGFVVSESGGGVEQSGSDLPTVDDVVVLWGTGGGAIDPADVASLVTAARPGVVWSVGSGADVTGSGVVDLGWLDDVASVLTNHPVVVASAGNNAVADAAGAKCPLVVVPQTRPFEEQVRHAESLDRAGVAAIGPVGADATAWRTALVDARHRAGALARLCGDGDGARRAADAIERAFDVGGGASEPVE